MIMDDAATVVRSVPLFMAPSSSRGSTLVSCFPSKPQECLCLMNPALLELEEGGDVVNELVVGAPEDAPN
jgi:hypothetical protein